MDASPPAVLPAPPPAAGVDREAYCPACHYNLFGTVSDKCPECGLAFDLATLCESQIPWVHSKKIGRWRAYARTARMVRFNPRKFAYEACRPVCYADANRFRWVNIGVAWACGVPLLVLIAWCFGQTSYGEMVGIIGLAIVTLAESAGWLLFLVAASALPSDWRGAAHLADQERQRAATLSYYATAGLVWTPLSLGLIFFALLVTIFNVYPARSTGPGTFGLIGIMAWPVGLLFLVLQVFWIWLISLILYRRTTQASAVQAWLFAIILPLTWLLYGLLFLVGLPAAVLYLELMVQSLK